VITPTTEFNCTGSLKVGDLVFGDDVAPGWINVGRAIEISSNVFFYNVGMRLGIEKLGETAAALGLGKLTNIELPGEAMGVMSSPAEKQKSGRGAWYTADTVQASVGQLDSRFTPLQMANYMAVLLRGGKEYQIHIIKKVTSYDNSETLIDNDKVTSTSDFVIPDDVLQTVKQGMRRVVEEGTAHNVFGGYAIPVGGKTGTSQNGLGLYDGVFVGFAPYDDPEIVVAAVIENGHYGNQTAPIARSVFNYYFNLAPSQGDTSNGTPVVGRPLVAADNTLLK
jgi:penicillin-binding protein 2